MFLPICLSLKYIHVAQQAGWVVRSIRRGANALTNSWGFMDFLIIKIYLLLPCVTPGCRTVGPSERRNWNLEQIGRFKDCFKIRSSLLPRVRSFAVGDFWQ